MGCDCKSKKREKEKVLSCNLIGLNVLSSQFYLFIIINIFLDLSYLYAFAPDLHLQSPTLSCV